MLSLTPCPSFQSSCYKIFEFIKCFLLNCIKPYRANSGDDFKYHSKKYNYKFFRAISNLFYNFTALPELALNGINK
ncbi:hypothetical protein BpHYR1_026523 [Brachionus plicatilis]|uniref:Uncharacterized protein n=1 Tax=Brachionus plicatilis TaxID=10195 RepID=A0A3M7QTS8_BRAPC|nr:hypothetical protein BpHYR1_026523 [Brachionus plicatilis]